MLVYRCTGQIQVGKLKKNPIAPISFWRRQWQPTASTLVWKIPWMEEPGRPAVHGVAKSQTRLSDFTFTFHFHALEKAMATHSSVLAWRIPGTEKPGGLPSMGSHRVGHNWSNSAAAAAASLSYHHTFRHRLKYVPYKIKTYLPRVFPASILVKNWHTYIVLSW